MSIQAVGWAFEQRGITPAQKLVLISLADFANGQNECFPSQRKIADRCCLSRQGVNAAISALQKAGIISKKKQERDDGSTTSCVYSLNIGVNSVDRVVSAVETPACQPDGQGMSSGKTPILEPSSEPSIGTVKEENARENALAPSHAHGPFEVFWEAFPNKVGKEAARKSWDGSKKKPGARTKVPFEQLMAALRRYREKTDDRPWCNPATWLNQERWNDVPAPPVIPQNRDPQKQELKDVIGQLRGNGTSKASGGRIDGLLLENSRIGGPDIRGEIGGIANELSWDGEQDCESDQRDTGEVQILSFSGRHQARA
jgi:hypothetical protein